MLIFGLDYINAEMKRTCCEATQTPMNWNEVEIREAKIIFSNM